jgi:signal transduction histidine kinase
MSWITVLWCVGGTAAASLGVIYFVIWLHEQKSRGSLVFSIIAISVAGIASTEVGMMHSATPEEFGFWVHWFHIPAFFTITATVLFVRVYFGVGRIWLAGLIVGLRCIVLAGDFALPEKFVYCKIVTLERVPFLGEMVAAPGRVLLNPWRWLPTISVLLFGAFVVDAAISLWRKGGDGRRKAGLVGGGIITVFLSIVQTQLTLWGFLRMPLLVSPPFLITLGAMAWELGRDLLLSRRAQRESAELRHQLAHAGRVTIMGQFASALAHELNQPLTAILSNAQAGQLFLERNPSDTAEIRGILDDIVIQDRRAGEIIASMRAMIAKGEARLEWHDVNAIIREVLVMVHSDLVARKVSVSVQSCTPIVRIHGDRIQLQQVLLNLIVNGCEAMINTPPDSRSLSIVTAHNGSGLAQVSVADGGTGIAPGLLERVFDPFFTTKRSGLGVGLPLCRSIIVAHGGRLWASNNPKGGATFHFTIPFEATQQRQSANSHVANEE